MLRGEIYIFNLPDMGENIQRGVRPVICVSNDINNRESNTVQVLAITTREDGLPFHVEINCIGKKSYVMCEQIFTVRQRDCMKYIGNATKYEMAMISQALIMQIGGII